MKPKRLPHELVRKYLANQCNQEELQQINDWYTNLDLKNDQEGYLFSEDELFNRIREGIGQNPEPSKKRIGTNWLKRIVQIAAVGILVCGIYFVYKSGKTAKEQPLAQQTLEPQKLSKTVHFNNNQKKIVRHLLPDGTKVWLNPGAVLDYPKSFDGLSFREIRFTGEAFFDVAHDKQHPFIIYSGKLKTQVLGTSFNLKANENGRVFKVSVLTGSVEVTAPVLTGNELKTIVIKPNEQMVFETATSNMRLVEVMKSDTKLLTWQPVSLKFDDVPMSAVIARLEQTFAVEITVSSPRLATCRLKIDFENQRLPEILEMINVVLGARYEINGESVVLIGDGC